METNLISLRKGMLLKAIIDTVGCSDSYNTPETIDIPKGTIISVPSQGTRMGDVFCELIEGVAFLHSRSPSTEGQLRELKPKTDNDGKPWVDVIGLIPRGGYKMGGGPWALGKIDLNVWEITNVSEEEITKTQTLEVFKSKLYQHKNNETDFDSYLTSIYKRGIEFIERGDDALLVDSWVDKTIEMWKCPSSIIG